MADEEQSVPGAHGAFVARRNGEFAYLSERARKSNVLVGKLRGADLPPVRDTGRPGTADRVEKAVADTNGTDGS